MGGERWVSEYSFHCLPLPLIQSRWGWVTRSCEPGAVGWLPLWTLQPHRDVPQYRARPWLNGVESWLAQSPGHGEGKLSQRCLASWVQDLDIHLPHQDPTHPCRGGICCLPPIESWSEPHCGTWETSLSRGLASA